MASTNGKKKRIRAFADPGAGAEKADANESLLMQLVKGLEDIREGRIKLWKQMAIG